MANNATHASWVALFATKWTLVSGILKLAGYIMLVTATASESSSAIISSVKA